MRPTFIESFVVMLIPPIAWGTIIFGCVIHDFCVRPVTLLMHRHGYHSIEIMSTSPVMFGIENWKKSTMYEGGLNTNQIPLFPVLD